MSPTLAIFVLPLIGAIVTTVIQSIWYGPLFSKAYTNAMGINPMAGDPVAMKKSMMVSIVLEFIMSFVLFFGFFTILGMAQAGTYIASLIFGSIFWFFIIMPQKASAAIWSGKGTRASWTLFGIGAGVSLISFLIVAPLFIWLVKFVS